MRKIALHDTEHFNSKIESSKYGIASVERLAPTSPETLSPDGQLSPPLTRPSLQRPNRHRFNHALFSASNMLSPDEIQH